MRELAKEHLRLRLRRLHRALAAAVGRQSEFAARLSRPDLTPFCVTSEHAELLFARLADDAPPPPAEPTDDERAAERSLRQRAAEAGHPLPLDALATRFRLDPAAVDALLLVAAPELDPTYERIYAYIVDNLNRRLPSPELLASIVDCRESLGPAAPLRRYGLIRPAPGASPGLAQELLPAPGLAELLTGAPLDADLIGHDPDEVRPTAGPPPPGAEELRRLGHAVAAGRVNLVGLWGATAATRRDAALALAAAAGRPLRRLPPAADPHPDPHAETDVAEAVRTAAMLNAVLWIPTGTLAHEPAGDLVTDLLTRTRVPAVLTGDAPWRAVGPLAVRDYAELSLPAPDYPHRRAGWAAVLPDLDADLRAELAARYRMSGEELRAVAAVTRTGARFAGNGRPAPLADHVRPALSAVTSPKSSAQGYVLRPRRTLDDLVLPPEHTARILEIASAFRAWPRVAEAWGFGRRPGEAGVKVLFTGESGTGKTLSAEVLAGIAGLDLFKIDLSQVVSKWIGETEKNLELAFRQAEEGHVVLFFDEADALFGKRGEVKHGTDRYANLEVGYLLQRLEASPAPAILATNLRDNIDPAFTRRFHFMLSFTRPGPAERRRLWRLAFPAEAPLAPDVDVDALSRLDMTGAAIASAARSGAVLAADEAGGSITMRHVVAGVARQYQREARLLRPAELGPHARLLGATAPDRRGT